MPVRDRLRTRLPELWCLLAHGKALTRQLDAWGFDFNTFTDLLAAEPALKECYQVALDAQIAWWADEIITISDDTSGETIVDPKTGARRQNSEWANGRRLQVDSRKWILSKLKPERFGDSLDHATQGGQKEVPWPVLMLPPLDEKP